MIACGAIALALFLVMFVIIFAFWIVLAAIAITSPVIKAVGIMYILNSDIVSGIAFIALGMILTGITILTFYGCIYTTKEFFGILRLKRYKL